jgi:hypothetical protein
MALSEEEGLKRYREKLENKVEVVLGTKTFEADLRHRIKTHPSKHDGIIAKHEDFREAVFVMGKIIGTLVPKGSERDLALTKLEEMMFWGNAGIARNQAD